ncbi:GPI mannosyltransferase 2, putative [Plasmodium knowlesi strain H]|uniref:GPI mannosyltransferase 2 n=3 Tax=Plasmodium knowlesi TaxID=5850 RepID=A0A5E7X9A1_PLAKH|nr:GPI mannosyltransferase 2, putative [Plasmodium knowlesi strain H]OTN63634.1 GPI mannosyltransferase 2 [Plasmodium knowlesi]CAA9991267.1 GPI mannosyltransferase 2, putative [Plasmodium knowlesi strain H]SBO26354.1 GPI mannosyltransferase 2, putative [Plasmodium knowlesi strain H]SBO29026.1 GPI mannosyltransferase 2, putative [Plasmodium knowlesi strain H]VVS80741.1 GPI mannosyltransferase 2, putative [Plasmodium knowlesi strain H]
MGDEGRANPQQGEEEGADKTKQKVTVDVLNLAVTSFIVRALTTAYTIIWSRLISSYKSSNDLLCDEEKWSLWSYVKCFSSWDGEYFLRLSLNEAEYLYEQNHAFFPALPLVVGYLKRLMGGVLPQISACSMHVLIAIIANNFFFIFSVIGLYLFVFTSLGRAKAHIRMFSEKQSTKKRDDYMGNVKSVEDCRRLSFMAALLFTFNIGSIHMSSFYSEGFFTCLSIWGFTFLQWSLNIRNGSFTLELLGVLSFSIASFFRSNGILFLIPLFVHTLRTCTFCMHCAGVLSLRLEPHKTYRAQILSHFTGRRIFLQFVLHWAKALLEAALVVLPLLTFQAYAYYLYCVEKYDNLWREEHKNFLNFSLSLWANPLEYASTFIYTYRKDELIRRPWCDKTIPFIYSYIQNKYWGVQFLKLLRSPNGNVLYALPVYLMSFHAVYHFFRNRIFPQGGISLLFTPFLGEVLHLGVLCLYLLIFAHGEIILRLIASSPFFYIHYAYHLKYSDKWNLILLVNLVYFFVGPPLFGTYIAWT